MIYRVINISNGNFLEEFGGGFLPVYSKLGHLFTSHKIAIKNLDKANKYSRNQGLGNLFEIKTYELVEIEGD